MDCLRMYAGDYFALAAACFPEFDALTLDEKVRFWCLLLLLLFPRIRLISASHAAKLRRAHLHSRIALSDGESVPHGRGTAVSVAAF